MVRNSASGGAWMALALLMCLVLSSCAPADDAEALFYDLDHPDYEVRFEAQERLAQIMRDGRYDAFLRSMNSDNQLIRANSIVYLGQMPQPDSRRALRSLLAVDKRMMLPFNPVHMNYSSEKIDSRVIVATMFHRTEDDPEAITTLLEGTSVDQEQEVVVGTCLAIGALGDARGVPFLAEASGHQDVKIVRAAIEALGHVRGPEALAALTSKIKHPSRVVRIDILSALDIRPRSESAEAIRALGSGDAAADVRRTAIAMLAVSGDAGLVPYLIARLNDPDKAVRLAAIAGLERVTGQALGESAADWEAWWAENEGTINAAR